MKAVTIALARRALSAPLVLHPASLAVGALLCGVVLLSMAQSSNPGSDSWPPAKKEILNICNDQQAQGSNLPITIVAGATCDVIDVPSDRWLTITGASLSVSSGFGNLRWKEQFQGIQYDKGEAAPSSLAYIPQVSGPIGWTFRPGSKVVLKNDSMVGNVVIAYALIGYFSRN